MFTPFANTNQFNPAAGAFINASGIGGIEAVAVNNLVNQLQEAGLWGKFNAVYPFVGGTAESHKWNLINPQDTNAAYRIVWGGTVTHNENGATGNGTSGWGNTFLTPALAGGGQNNVHISGYFRTTTTARVAADMGATTVQATSALAFNVKNPSNLFNTAGNVAAFNGTANTLPGYFTVTRDNSANYRRAINSTISTVTATSATVSTTPIAVLAWNNNGTAGNFSDRNIALATIGFGLTDADIVNLVNINQTFQSTLGRAV